MEKLIKEVLKREGFWRRKHSSIDGYFIGVEFIKVKITKRSKFLHTPKLFKSHLITICISNARLSKITDDWYIHHILNLGGK